jgi:YVTN family beta-propeller protein
LSVIDTSSLKVTANIATGSKPNGIAVSPDGNFVYVTIAGEAKVSVINVATGKIVSDIQVGKGPAAIADSFARSVG